MGLPVSASPVPGLLGYTTKPVFFMWVLVIDGHSWSNRDGDILAQRTILYGAGGLEETKASAFTSLKPYLWVQIVLFNYSIAVSSSKFLIHLWGTTRQVLFFFINGICPISLGLSSHGATLTQRACYPCSLSSPINYQIIFTIQLIC